MTAGIDVLAFKVFLDLLQGLLGLVLGQDLDDGRRLFGVVLADELSQNTYSMILMRLKIKPVRFGQLDLQVVVVQGLLREPYQLRGNVQSYLLTLADLPPLCNLHQYIVNSSLFWLKFLIAFRLPAHLVAEGLDPNVEDIVLDILVLDENLLVKWIQTHTLVALHRFVEVMDLAEAEPRVF